MDIRLLNANELREASETALAVYTECILPYARTPEEIEAFQRYISEDHLWAEYCKRKLYVWGAFENGRMRGVSAMESTGRITMLYVLPSYQKAFCEDGLMRAMRQWAIDDLGLSFGDVQVELIHPDYRKVQEPEQQVQSWEQSATQEVSENQSWKKPETQEMLGNQNWGQTTSQYGTQPAWQGQQSKKRGVQAWFGILALVAGIILVVVLLWCMFEGIFGYWKEQDTPNYAGILGPWQERAESEIGEGGSMEELPNYLGIDLTVPLKDVYVADDLEYSVSMECIEMADDPEEEGRMQFDIAYPQITYQDGRDVSAVNQILRDCACAWYDKMYPEVKEDELIYDEESPYLESTVEYEITYMSNDLISVIYYDHYFGGNVYSEYGDLRTRVIDLNTGELYEIEDIITHDEAFDQIYYEKLLEESDGLDDATALNSTTVGATLDGSWVDGRYYSNYIISGKGLQLGLTYHYGDGNYYLRGWTTVDYTVEELESYKTDSALWELYVQ